MNTRARLTLILLCVCPMACKGVPAPAAPLASFEVPFWFDETPEVLEVPFHNGHMVVVPGEDLCCRAIVDVFGEAPGSITPSLRRGEAAGSWTVGIDVPSGAHPATRHVTYHVQLPATIALRVRTERGSIDLRGVAGDVYAESRCGSIRARVAGGRVHLATGSGSVSLCGSYHSAKVESGCGAIDVRVPSAEGIDPQVEVCTESGHACLALSPRTCIGISCARSWDRVHCCLPPAWHCGAKAERWWGPADSNRRATARLWTETGRFTVAAH